MHLFAVSSPQMVLLFATSFVLRRARQHKTKGRKNNIFLSKLKERGEKIRDRITSFVHFISFMFMLGERERERERERKRLENNSTFSLAGKQWLVKEATTCHTQCCGNPFFFFFSKESEKKEVFFGWALKFVACSLLLLLRFTLFPKQLQTASSD